MRAEPGKIFSTARTSHYQTSHPIKIRLFTNITYLVKYNSSMDYLITPLIGT